MVGPIKKSDRTIFSFGMVRSDWICRYKLNLKRISTAPLFTERGSLPLNHLEIGEAFAWHMEYEADRILILISPLKRIFNTRCVAYTLLL